MVVCERVGGKLFLGSPKLKHFARHTRATQKANMNPSSNPSHNCGLHAISMAPFGEKTRIDEYIFWWCNVIMYKRTFQTALRSARAKRYRRRCSCWWPYLSIEAAEGGCSYIYWQTAPFPPPPAAHPHFRNAKIVGEPRCRAEYIHMSRVQRRAVQIQHTRMGHRPRSVHATRFSAHSHRYRWEEQACTCVF